jgi:MFS family permease
MKLTRRFGRLSEIYREYPSQFWVLVGAAFIDRLGGAMLFPFFTLYLTKKFAIGMTQVGVLFAIFSISSVIGSMIGGALTDRLGRKGMLMFGLVMSAMTALLMGVIDAFWLFMIVIPLVGMLADAAGPAQQALVADLLPEEKRTQGFGILRVVFNLAVTIGPLIGGLIASRSYLMLFIIDAITSLVTAAIVYFTLRETLRPKPDGKPEESLAQTFGGYGVAFRDGVYVWFLAASALMVLVYMQMNTTLAVFLRDVHGIDERGFSYVLSLNAGMVVLMQFWITQKTSQYRPLVIMTVGTLLYAIGFALYGFVATFFLFLFAMVIITIGEMLVSPVGQAIVARLAPEDMRGRYMAVYGFSWVVPTAFGPLLAGLVMDNFDPRWLWYLAGIVGLVATLTFFIIERRVDRAGWSAIDQRLKIIEQLEEGRISAAAAARQLEAIGESPWMRLAPAAPNTSRRHLRIRISDLNSGVMKTDLRLPLGLINTVLMVGGQFSPDLDNYDAQRLHEIISQSADGGDSGQLEDGQERLEVSVE